MMVDSSGISEFAASYQTYFEVVRAETTALLDRVYRLRYQVYCVENRFEDPGRNPGGRRVDADDERADHILLVHRYTGEDAGTARVILPPLDETRRPLPIEQALLPQDRRDFARLPPRRTAEISHFAVSKAFRKRLGERRHAAAGAPFESPGPQAGGRRYMPHITFGLVRGILDICLEYGITHVAAVMEPALIRRLLRFGLEFEPIGRPVDYQGRGQPCAARLAELIARARGGQNVLWHVVRDGIPEDLAGPAETHPHRRGAIDE